jgi:hypothetical protein
MLRREVEILRPALVCDRILCLIRGLIRSWPTATPVHDRLGAPLLIVIPQTAKMPLAHPQQLSRLYTAEPLLSHPSDRINDPSHTNLRKQNDPPGENRTNRVLRKADISSGADTDAGLAFQSCLL